MPGRLERRSASPSILAFLFEAGPSRPPLFNPHSEVDKMERRRSFGTLLAALIVLALAAAAPQAASAANCQCYYSSDCSDPTTYYCNWKAECTRHCELQGTWKADWGQPPVSKADCDKYTGPCHDNEPQPPMGDDGDGENCEPPTTTNPDGDKMSFKVRDGNCAKRETVTPKEPAEEEVRQATGTLLQTLEAGGGFVALAISPYMADVMENLALLALGQYDYAFAPEGEPSWMADVRGTCGAEAIQALSDGLLAEMDAAVSMASVMPVATAFGRPSPGGTSHPFLTADGSHASEILRSLPAECQEWVQSRPHDCQFPHPEEHHHVFDYEDGIACISAQLGAMAGSMNLTP
jgi:hypothetical protein